MIVVYNTHKSFAQTNNHCSDYTKTEKSNWYSPLAVTLVGLAHGIPFVPGVVDNIIVGVSGGVIAYLNQNDYIKLEHVNQQISNALKNISFSNSTKKCQLFIMKNVQLYTKLMHNLHFL